MRYARYCGFVGVACLQASAIPAIIQAIRTGESAPAATILLIIIGLACCTVQEIHAKLWAYVAGSVLSILGHVSILILIGLK